MKHILILILLLTAFSCQKSKLNKIIGSYNGTAEQIITRFTLEGDTLSSTEESVNKGVSVYLKGDFMYLVNSRYSIPKDEVEYDKEYELSSEKGDYMGEITVKFNPEEMGYQEMFTTKTYADCTIVITDFFGFD